MAGNRRYHFYVCLKKVLEDKGMTQKELAEITGIREATISEIANNSRNVVNKVHLGKIMDALNLTDLNDILVVTVEDRR